jgi:hypothetical protein
MGNGSVTPWEKPELTGEGIAVEYSLNQGASWTAITNVTTWLTNWTYIQVPIPPASQSVPVSFRWKQLGSPTSNTDNWALDNIYYGADPTKPVIVAQITNLTVFAESNAVIPVQVTGSQPLSYQWYYNNGLLDGKTNATLTLTAVQTNQAGTYFVVVTNALGSATSAPIVLSVEVPPPPFNGYDLQRDFSVVSNPNGVWSYGCKTNLLGTFLLNPISWTSYDDQRQPVKFWLMRPGDNPYVGFNPNTISNLCDYGRTWLPPKTVYLGPANSTYIYSAVRFTVPNNEGGDYLIQSGVKTVWDSAASGDSEFHVLTNGVEVFSVNLPAHGVGGYTNALTLPPGATADFVVGRGPDRNSSGSDLKLQVLISCVTNYQFAPIIVTQSTNQTVFVGSNAVLEVQATGSKPLGCQWYFSNGLLSGETNLILTLNGVQTNQAGTYLVVVTNALGSATSAPIVLSVEVPPPPFNGYDLQRDFSVVSNPNGVWSYGCKTNLLGAFLLNPIPWTSYDDQRQPVKFWLMRPGDNPYVGFNPNTTSNLCDYGHTWLPPKTVYLGPANSTYIYSAVRFTVPNNEGGDYLIQSGVKTVWDSAASGDSEFHVLTNGVEVFSVNLPAHGVSGYTNALTLPPGATLDFVVGRGPDGDSSGSDLKLQALISCVTNYQFAPTIVSQSSNQLVYAGSNVTLHVWASGTAPLQYQWYFNSAPMTNGTNIALAFTPVAIGNAGTYFAVVSNTIATATSSPILLTVRVPNQEPPVITQQPMGASVGVGSSAAFTVTVKGSAPLDYQWYFNGLLMIGATNQTLTLTNLQTSAGGTYTVIVTNQYGKATSAGAVLNVDNYVGGAFLFANFYGTNRAWIYDIDGKTKLEGAQYLAQLYAGIDALNLQPIGAAVPFKTGYFAGLFSGGARYVSTISPGTMASLQVKAWDSGSGSTYELASAAGGKVGSSVIFTAVSGGFLMPPMPLTGLNSFSLQLNFTPSPLPAMAQTLQNRATPIVQISSLVGYTNGMMMLNATGEQGMSYQIQMSEDFKTWTIYTNMVNYDGAVGVLDSIKSTGGKFYRILVVE